MFRYLSLIFLSLWVMVCSAQDEHYYSKNPQALQKVLQQCPTQQKGLLSCTKLNELAAQMNLLAYELRANPQGFGKQILALQERIAQQEEILSSPGKKTSLRAHLQDNKDELQRRLAVVKWLESP